VKLAEDPPPFGHERDAGARDRLAAAPRSDRPFSWIVAAAGRRGP
jgi:hypothetical protein